MLGFVGWGKSARWSMNGYTMESKQFDEPLKRQQTLSNGRIYGEKLDKIGKKVTAS